MMHALKFPMIWNEARPNFLRVFSTGTQRGQLASIVHAPNHAANQTASFHNTPINLTSAKPLSPGQNKSLRIAKSIISAYRSFERRPEGITGYNRRKAPVHIGNFFYYDIGPDECFCRIPRSGDEICLDTRRFNLRSNLMIHIKKKHPEQWLKIHAVSAKRRTGKRTWLDRVRVSFEYGEQLKQIRESREQLGGFDPDEGEMVKYETHEAQAKIDEILESKKEKEKGKTPRQNQEVEKSVPPVNKQSGP